MASSAQIRKAVERVVAVFRKKPSAGMGTSYASGRVENGLTCHFRQGEDRAVMDLPVPVGGDGSAPTPGFFMRAGLVGCVAIGVKMTAAREGIEVEAVDVDVEMDFDDGAMFGLGNNTAAPLETRMTITVESSAPWDEVTALVGRALECDPFFLALRDAQSVKTKLVSARG